MDRRRFLMGMGAFTGAALFVPKVATIFDMGRDTGLALPPVFWESVFVTAQWLDRQRTPPRLYKSVIYFGDAADGRYWSVALKDQSFTVVASPSGVGPVRFIVPPVYIVHGSEEALLTPGFSHTFSDGAYCAELDGVIDYQTPMVQLGGWSTYPAVLAR